MLEAGYCHESEVIVMKKAIWNRFLLAKLGDLTKIMKKESKLADLTNMLLSLQELESKRQSLPKKKSSDKKKSKLASDLQSAKRALLPQTEIESQTTGAPRCLDEIDRFLSVDPTLTLELQTIPAPARDPLFRGNLSAKPRRYGLVSDQEREYCAAFADMVKLRVMADMRVHYLDVPVRALELHHKHRQQGYSRPETLVERLICETSSVEYPMSIQILAPRLVALCILRPGVPFVSPSRIELQIFYKGPCVFRHCEIAEEDTRSAEDFIDFHFLMERSGELLFLWEGTFWLLKLASHKVVLRMEDKYPPEEEPEEIQELCHELQKYEQEYFYHDCVEPNPTDYGFEEGESVNISDLEIDMNHGINELTSSPGGISVKAANGGGEKCLHIGYLYEIKVTEAARYPHVHGTYRIWVKLDLRRRQSRRLGPVSDSEIGQPGTDEDLESCDAQTCVLNWSHGYASFYHDTAYVHIVDGFKGKFCYPQADAMVETIRSSYHRLKENGESGLWGRRISHSQQDLLLGFASDPKNNSNVLPRLLVYSLYPWVSLGTLELPIAVDLRGFLGPVLIPGQQENACKLVFRMCLD